MMYAADLKARPAANGEALPRVLPRLEEVAAREVRDFGPAFGFAFMRLVEGAARARARDDRPFVFAATRGWLRECGRPCAQGIARWRGAPSRLILIAPQRETEALWALEEALKSGAVAGGLAAVERVAFVTTRRLDFAARTGGATAILLRPGPAEDLSAAHLRWRVTGLGSGEHDLDPRAPGPVRLEARLVRRRDGPPGTWVMERDDETHRLRLAARLAGDGLVEDARTNAAA